MSTEDIRANLTDEELIARAKAAGWEWFEKGGACGAFTGWMVSNSHRINCKPEAKAEVLRGKVGTHPGLDHRLDCRECGRPIWLTWSNDSDLVRYRECFGCNIWLSHARALGPKSVIVGETNGTRGHYWIGPRKVPNYINGFGGDWWTVTFGDGREVDTCDLWAQGNIPKRFWDRLPVNAVLHRGIKFRPRTV